MVGQPHHNSPSSVDARLIHLICQAQSSDISTRNRALERLLQRHLSFIRSFASGLSSNDAEEAMQSARVALVLNIPGFHVDAGVRLTTYLRKPARQAVDRNSRINAGGEDPKKRKRWIDQHEDSIDAAVSHCPVWTSASEADSGNLVDLAELAPDRSAETAFALADKQIEVRRFVASLPAQQQTVYDLLYVQQMTQAEAAQRMGISQARVSQLDRAICRAGSTALAHLVATA